jgi:hypothetical protein
LFQAKLFDQVILFFGTYPFVLVWTITNEWPPDKDKQQGQNAFANEDPAPTEMTYDPAQQWSGDN